MTVIEWSNPPLDGRHRWHDRLIGCTERPQDWALVHETWRPETAYGAVRDLRSGRLHAPPGQWDYKCRKRPNGQTGVWARYLGPEED